GSGKDTLTGNAGSDTADYSASSVAVRVTLDGAANDGTPGENDSIAADVENATGGSGDDTLRGSAGANKVAGGPGDDDIDPAAGSDEVDAVAGADTVAVQDDETDAVACGDGLDTVTADLFDKLKPDC